MRFREFGESGLKDELLYWVSSPIRVARTTHELNRWICGRLAELDMEIAFRKMDGTLAETSPETVHTHSEPSPGDD